MTENVTIYYDEVFMMKFYDGVFFTHTINILIYKCLYLHQISPKYTGLQQRTELLKYIILNSQT